MTTILILVKIKSADKFDDYTEPMFFRVLNCYDYKLIDIFTDKFNKKLYYYFEGPDRIKDYMYLDIYHHLKELIPDYAYIKKVEPKHSHSD